MEITRRAGRPRIDGFGHKNLPSFFQHAFCKYKKNRWLRDQIASSIDKRFGSLGFYVYLVLIANITSQNGYWIDWGNFSCSPSLSIFDTDEFNSFYSKWSSENDETRVKEVVIPEVINGLIDLELFDRELCERGILTGKNIQYAYEHVSKELRRSGQDGKRNGCRVELYKVKEDDREYDEDRYDFNPFLFSNNFVRNHTELCPNLGVIMEDDVEEFRSFLYGVSSENDLIMDDENLAVKEEEKEKERKNQRKNKEKEEETLSRVENSTRNVQKELPFQSECVNDDYYAWWDNGGTQLTAKDFPEEIGVVVEAWNKFNKGSLAFSYDSISELEKINIHRLWKVHKDKESYEKAFEQASLSLIAQGKPSERPWIFPWAIRPNNFTTLLAMAERRQKRNPKKVQYGGDNNADFKAKYGCSKEKMFDIDAF